MHRIENCSRNSKNGIEILVGQVVFLVIDQNSQNVGFWINNARTAWSTVFFMLFLSSLDNLL